MKINLNHPIVRKKTIDFHNSFELNYCIFHYVMDVVAVALVVFTISDNNSDNYHHTLASWILLNISLLFSFLVVCSTFWLSRRTPSIKFLHYHFFVKGQGFSLQNVTSNKLWFTRTWGRTAVCSKDGQVKTRITDQLSINLACAHVYRSPKVNSWNYNC